MSEYDLSCFCCQRHPVEDCPNCGHRMAESDLHAIEAEARARLAEAVRGLRVRANVRDETRQEGFRQSRNETVAAVRALLEQA